MMVLLTLTLVSIYLFQSPILVWGKLPTTVAKNVNVIIVGGSSGMGKAAALATVQRGGTVMLVGRTQSKLHYAKEKLLEQVPGATIVTRVCDVSDESAVETLANEIEKSLSSSSSSSAADSNNINVSWNGLVISAAGRAPHGSVLDLPTSATREMMESKVWTAYHCAKHLGPKLQPDSCIVFVAGILNRRPGINCAPLAMANGALEGLTRSLALEWGPRVRVNCLSPGFCDTERFDHLDPERKERTMLANTAASLPLQKVGQPSDMGEAIFYLLTSPFCTGVVLDVDGGHGIRQYANPNTDPMRKQE